MKKDEELYKRLKTCIVKDKGGAMPQAALDLLKQDLNALLSQYFDLASLSADLDYDPDGELWLIIDGRVKRVINSGRAREVVKV